MRGHGSMEYDGPRAFHKKGPIAIGALGSGFSINPLEFFDAISASGLKLSVPGIGYMNGKRRGVVFVYMGPNHIRNFDAGLSINPLWITSDAISAWFRGVGMWEKWFRT